MTTTPLHPQPGGAAMRRADTASSGNPAVDLERFWPSRRGHAFDEFCR